MQTISDLSCMKLTALSNQLFHAVLVVRCDAYQHVNHKSEVQHRGNVTIDVYVTQLER